MKDYNTVRIDLNWSPPDLGVDIKPWIKATLPKNCVIFFNGRRPGHAFIEFSGFPLPIDEMESIGWLIESAIVQAYYHRFPLMRVLKKIDHHGTLGSYIIENFTGYQSFKKELKLLTKRLKRKRM